MKKFILISSALVTTFFTNSHGDGYMKSSYQYNQIFENEVVNSISVNGSVLINNTTVKDTVSINGALLAIKSVIGSMVVNGGVRIKDSTIREETMINGALKAEETKFSGLLSIASEKTILENCETSKLIIRKNGSNNPLQIVELTGNTTVNGDIVFESNNGLVIFSNNVVLLGNVIGGEIRQQ